MMCVHLCWIFLKTVSHALATPISTLPHPLAQTCSLYDDIFIHRILAESGAASRGLVAMILMLVLWALAYTPSSVFGDRYVHVCICVRVSASAHMCGHTHVCVFVNAVQISARLLHIHPTFTHRRHAGEDHKRRSLFDSLARTCLQVCSPFHKSL